MSNVKQNDMTYAQDSKKEQDNQYEQKLSDNKLNIAMVSDFFYPNVGGVEGHIYALSQHLMKRGHKVIVITHSYEPDRSNVRYLSSGLKVYHVPYRVIARQDTLPNFFAFFPILRSILIRENIQIIHAHQALSSMGLEALLHGRTMGLRTIFTDHSLFGFADTASILTNKLLQFFLSDIDHMICVSHTAKENTVLRANIKDPSKVFVIPNAIVSEHFTPRAEIDEKTKNKITIVLLSRLMYRKGIDLLVGAIPRLCEQHPEISFIIGGDGPKRIELEQVREQYSLYDRIELCGAIRQGNVRDHLIRGDIFLNTSLTEAFGTGIIEAACCGLFVVSTRVGGIPEVLPPHMIRLAKPEEDDIVDVVCEAIEYIKTGKHDPQFYHQTVQKMYSWSDVAQRVENVYSSAQKQEMPSFIERLMLYRTVGPIAGIIFCIIASVDVLFHFILNLLVPVETIDILPNVTA